MQHCSNMLGLVGQLSLLHEAKVRTKPAWMASRPKQGCPRVSSLWYHEGRPLRVSLYPEYLLSNCPRTVHNAEATVHERNPCLSFRLSTKPLVILYLFTQPSFTRLPKRTCHYLIAILLPLSKRFLEGDIYSANSYL